MKRRRIMMEKEDTGDRAGAQRGESQGLPVHRTPANLVKKSKLGHNALEMEALVVPPQGVFPLFSLGPTIAEATPGPTENADQASMEGSTGVFKELERTEDLHEEEETDKERLKRLMLYDGRVRRCTGCGGRPFHDRHTLRRHCKSSVHRTKRDMRKSPFCRKEFRHMSSANRHIEQKHPENGIESTAWYMDPSSGIPDRHGCSLFVSLRMASFIFRPVAHRWTLLYPSWYTTFFYISGQDKQYTQR
ncbi:hypothetical protein BJV74DRAFT_491699 [Russula compacta]|nr:hypothetical protein BJV74DRAFT_491699 [Russula compacta]